jgi:PKD repeat protein
MEPLEEEPLMAKIAVLLGGRARGHLATFVVLVSAAAVLAVGAPQAQAVVVGAAPTRPIPSDAPPGPPPIPELPAASEAPPLAEQIADPVTPGAACGGWYLQSDYGARWPSPSTWWEYRCTYEQAEYYPHPCDSVACDAVCYGYPWDCYSLSEKSTDYFYWDGSQAVFYGQAYSYSVEDANGYSESRAYWWDEPTAQWYELGASAEPANASPAASFTSACSAGSCSFDASASFDSDGTLASYRFDFGDGSDVVGSAATAAHTYARSGSYTVTLTVTDDLGAAASASRVVTVELPNTPPVASFASTCAALSCDFDAGRSADPDGFLVAYQWDFGDGSSAAGKLVQHAYVQPGTYSVRLTVTDNRGASATVTETVLVLGLSASGYKVKGLQKVDLSWNGAASESFDVSRNGVVIATVSSGQYTDNVNGRGAGSYLYKVCARARNTCANEATVNF